MVHALNASSADPMMKLRWQLSATVRKHPGCAGLPGPVKPSDTSRLIDRAAIVHRCSEVFHGREEPDTLPCAEFESRHIVLQTLVSPNVRPFLSEPYNLRIRRRQLKTEVLNIIFIYLDHMDYGKRHIVALEFALRGN